ncbi:MAG: cupin domain-containing protein [Pseudomonadota bacterium]
MLINAELNKRAKVDSAPLPWERSPQEGVWRKCLERDGDEVARATSIVKYEPDSAFAAHEHGLGEEILVLEGVFCDEYGEYPAGTYLRNPPGSRHAPRSEFGCLLFVKLRQFDPDDQRTVRIDTRHARWYPGSVPGLNVMPLHEFGHEHIALVRWDPGTQFKPHAHFGGEEILVIDGVFEDEYGSYPVGTWLRSPHMSRHHPFSTQGCTIYVKTGHLPIAN